MSTSEERDAHDYEELWYQERTYGMTRLAAERTIRDTFNPRSTDPRRAEIGRELFAVVAEEHGLVALWDDSHANWPWMATEVVIRFAELCLERELAESTEPALP